MKQNLYCNELSFCFWLRVLYKYDYISVLNQEIRNNSVQIKWPVTIVDNQIFKAACAVNRYRVKINIKHLRICVSICVPVNVF